jgi:hypothetical protein
MTDTIDFRMSKDGGHNNTDWQHREIGPTGNFKRVPPFRRLGMSRQWVFEIRNTSERPCPILGAVAEIE